MSHNDLQKDNQSDQASQPISQDSEYRTLANGTLTPRHRRLAQLAASGAPNSSIAKELDYSESRISILLKNPLIIDEIGRLQERIFEETIAQRLKSFIEPALNNIQMILTDRSNAVKISEKMALSQWIIEKLDGKAVQKHEAGENLLSTIMDRLDASRTAPKQIVHVTQNIMHNYAAEPEGPGPATKDVTPLQIEAKSSEESELEAWISDFNASSQEK